MGIFVPPINVRGNLGSPWLPCTSVVSISFVHVHDLCARLQYLAPPCSVHGSSVWHLRGVWHLHGVCTFLGRPYTSMASCTPPLRPYTSMASVRLCGLCERLCYLCWPYTFVAFMTSMHVCGLCACLWHLWPLSTSLAFVHICGVFSHLWPLSTSVAFVHICGVFPSLWRLSVHARGICVCSLHL